MVIMVIMVLMVFLSRCHCHVNSTVHGFVFLSILSPSDVFCHGDRSIFRQCKLGYGEVLCVVLRGGCV